MSFPSSMLHGLYLVVIFADSGVFVHTGCYSDRSSSTARSWRSDVDEDFVNVEKK